jgi:precorrin-6Y C5,15-methyltransferase (decarboxylating)
VSFPSPSTFSLAANRLGWKLEETICIGLHAAPFSRLKPVLSANRQILCLVRDGDAVAELAAWLTREAAGDSALWVLAALGGPREQIQYAQAKGFDLVDISDPVAVAISVQGPKGLSLAPGLPDDDFAHDGQITKRPIRALTIAALAPRQGELLWDIGAGSGSVSIEWCLQGGKAIAVEAREDRAENIRTNAKNFGVDHLHRALSAKIIDGQLPSTLTDGPLPDAVFVGGGCSAALFEGFWQHLPHGTRLVVNGVTLETEALLVEWQNLRGVELHRFEVSTAAPLGNMRGWNASRPVVQWCVTI